MAPTGEIAAPPPETARAVPLRIRHVDSLRAVAAGLVMWLHFSQFLGPVAGPDPVWLGWLRRLPLAFDTGRMGVMVFFAISGFVICRSFSGPREGAAGRFVFKRFCRLYPAYWASLLGGVLVWWVTGQKLTWPLLAANVTMIPAALGQMPLLGVYWTLEIELLFYALCLGLYLLRGLDRPGLLTAGVILLTALPRCLRALDRHFGTHLTLSPGQPTLLLALAVMCWGAVFRLVYDGTHGFRRGVFRRWDTALLALGALALIDVPDPGLKWILLGLKPGPMSTQITMAAAVALFTLWVAWWRIDQPVLTYLGVISYSLYLFHLVVTFLMVRGVAASTALRAWQLPFWVYLTAGTLLTMAVSMATYRWIERPALALKQWVGPGRQSGGAVS